MKFSNFPKKMQRTMILIALICLSTMPLLAAAEDDIVLASSNLHSEISLLPTDAVLAPTDWITKDDALPDTDIYTIYQEVVPFPVMHLPDSTLPQGQTAIVQYGQAGRALVAAYVPNITQSERQPLHRAITEVPTAQVIVHGTQPPSMGTGMLTCPLQDYVFTSPFGQRNGSHHNGVDICAPEGTPVYAADNGIISFAGEKNGYGNCILLDHQNGMCTLYAHNSALLVQVGDIVAQGDTISQVGSTGNSTANHLHFEVQIEGVPQDPAQYIDF